jgi:hypothetical protein
MTINPNNWANYPNQGYRLEMETNYRWMRSLEGMITLQVEMVAYIDVGTDTPKRQHISWMSIANVYKAKRGNRYIAEVNGYRKLFPFHTLREAMRMAKFLHQTKSKL